MTSDGIDAAAGFRQSSALLPRDPLLRNTLERTGQERIETGSKRLTLLLLRQPEATQARPVVLAQRPDGERSNRSGILLDNPGCAPAEGHLRFERDVAR